MCKDYILPEKTGNHSKGDWLDKITKESEMDIDKICGSCKNWYIGWCKLNPVAVAKDAKDTCSYWADKLLNEYCKCR